MKHGICLDLEPDQQWQGWKVQLHTDMAMKSGLFHRRERCEPVTGNSRRMPLNLARFFMMGLDGRSPVSDHPFVFENREQKVVPPFAADLAVVFEVPFLPHPKFP